MSDDVILRRDGALGRVTLNRAGALNALTMEMCTAMAAGLAQWAADPEIKTVAIDAVPGRAFSAGGDIRAIYELGRKRDPRAAQFFVTEYRLNAAIRHFPKPYVALIDGIVMGGGAGVSIHGSHRLVSENALFAMPETAIGFLPDIGASYFLPRLPGSIGMSLALTGARLNAADMIHAGLATHFVPAARFPEMLAGLAHGDEPDGLLESLNQTPPCAPLSEYRAAIDRVFTLHSVEEILDALASEGDWGERAAKSIAAGSPTSVKLTFHAMREGLALDFHSCQRMEYRAVRHILRGHDYYEGVRARLIDKDSQPRWQPDRLDAVSDADIAVYFAPLGKDELAL